MMEQNRRIFRWLLVATAILTAASAVVVALRGPMETVSERISVVASMVATVALCMAIVVVAIRHPEWNRHYTVRLDGGKLRMKRRIYAPDPYGQRYKTYGLVVLLLALLVIATMILQIWGLPQWVGILVAVVIVIGIVVVVERCEKRLSAGEE